MNENYNRKNLKNSFNLNEKQKNFINSTQNRNIKYFNSKKKLFEYWDKNLEINKSIQSKERYTNLKHNVLSCGNWIEFEGSIKTKKIKLSKANFCHKDKLCPVCAVGRAYKQQNKFLKYLEVEPELLSKNWYYIVTPVQHNKSDTLDKIVAKVFNFRKKVLQQIRNSKRGLSSGFWSNFNGGMSAIEVTYSKNGWNVHINWLVNSDDKIEDIKEVTDNKKNWYQSDELSKFLNKFDNKSYIHSINKLDFSNKKEIKNNLVEVLKYSLKFSSMEPKQQIEAYNSFYHKQLFSVFGNLRGINLDNVDNDEIETNEIEEDYFFRLIYARVNNKYNLIYSKYKGNEIDTYEVQDYSTNEEIEPKIYIEQLETKRDYIKNDDELVEFEEVQGIEEPTELIFDDELVFDSSFETFFDDIEVFNNSSEFLDNS